MILQHDIKSNQNKFINIKYKIFASPTPVQSQPDRPRCATSWQLRGWTG